MLPSRRQFFSLLMDEGAILDIGCGDGRHVSQYPNTKNLSWYGIDRKDPPSLQPFLDAFKAVEFRRVDLEHTGIPWQADTFDGVFCAQVIEHLSGAAVEYLAKEIKRVLKPYGWLYVEAPSTRSLYLPSFARLLDDGGWQGSDLNFWDNYTHVRPFTERSLRAFMNEAGIDRDPVWMNKPCRQGRVRTGPWARTRGVANIIIGLSIGSRRRFCIGVWDLFGWSLYAHGSKSE